MTYDHKVKFNGIYYEAGEEIVMESENGNQPFLDSDIQFENSPHKYTYEELQENSVRKIRQIAEDMGITITKVIKDDVINEFLSKQ